MVYLAERLQFNININSIYKAVLLVCPPHQSCCYQVKDIFQILALRSIYTIFFTFQNVVWCVYIHVHFTGMIHTVHTVYTAVLSICSVFGGNMLPVLVKKAWICIRNPGKTHHVWFGSHNHPTLSRLGIESWTQWESQCSTI